jgi:uncharacterized protein (DUF433 family)
MLATCKFLTVDPPKEVADNREFSLCQQPVSLVKCRSEEALIMATDTTKNQSWVQKTPGVCGGRACIRNTRITVWGVVNSRRLGAADEQILENIVGLTPGDLHAAWEYYREHPAEIDEDIRDNEAD